METEPASRFETVARIVAGPNAPAWLAEHFERWSPSLTIDVFVHAIQPGRADVRKRLLHVKTCAEQLRAALNDNPTRGFLEDVPIGPIEYHGQIDHLLGDLFERAAKAYNSPELAKDGKTRPGRLKALPSAAVPPQVFCAALIAEAFNHFDGKYPSPRNEGAARAATELWLAAGCRSASWGDNPLTAWRHHFKKIDAPGLTKDRKEIRRHLKEAEHGYSFTIHK